MKVFVAGCGRSGTTYLKTLLESSDDLYIPPETLCLVDYLNNQNVLPLKRLAKMLYNEPQLKSWSQAVENYSFDNIKDTIQYIHEETARKKGARYWGQKTPRFINHIDLFNSAFNDIKWVLIYRDPRAVVASMLSSKRHTYSIGQAIERWKNDNIPILKFKKTPNPKVLIISYEELVLDASLVLKRVFEFLELRMPSLEAIFNYDYGKQSRNYKGYKFERNEIREGLKPNSSLIETWQSKLTQKQISFIENQCAEEMRDLEYTRVSIDFQPGLLFRFKNHVTKLGVFFIAFQYLINWPEYLIKSQTRKLVFFIYRRLW
jgi:hypothetical protein